MSLIVWSWLFLVVYMGGMLAFGLIGRSRVHDADDFATARAGYGPFFLALAFAATTASGATFLSMGGAHADILTDGVQGFLMLLIGVLVIVLFVAGAGLDGGLGAIISNIREQDPNQVGWINRSTPLYHSWWSQAAVLLAHIPLGLLPHIGNKIWALKGNKSRFTFLRFASVFGITLGMLGLGGALARAVLGGRLLEEGSTPNEALPALFIELFPAWLAALIGVGILAAVMSTADGLVVSSSQIVANDIYRRTLAPRFDSHLSAEQLDRRVLVISRWATLGVMIVCVTMAWMLMDMNIAILVWTGTGGMMAAFAGPLVLGALWSGVTRAGAYTGLLVGLSSFLVLHTGVIDPAWFEGNFLFPVFSWLHGESPNPTSCAALAGLFAIGCTTAVSLATKPLPEAHVASLFRRVAATK